MKNVMYIVFVFVLAFSACDGPVELVEGEEWLLSDAKVTNASIGWPEEAEGAFGWTAGDRAPPHNREDTGTWIVGEDSQIEYSPGQEGTTWRIFAAYFPKDDTGWQQLGSLINERIGIPADFRRGIVAFDIKVSNTNIINSAGEITAEIIGQPDPTNTEENAGHTFLKWDLKNFGQVPNTTNWTTVRLPTDTSWRSPDLQELTQVFRFAFNLIGMNSGDVTVTLRNLRFIEVIE